MAFTLEDLGRNIRTLRLSRRSRIKPGKSLLQYELAGLANIPTSSLSNIEKGKYGNPTWKLLSKIATALDCDVSAFYAERSAGPSGSEIAFNEAVDLVIRERLDRLLGERLKNPPDEK